MLKHFLTAAILGLFLAVGAAGQASAASFTPVSELDKQVSKATGGSALTKTGGGWWAVPVVVGGVVLLHHIHRRHHHHHYYHRCYRRCWWHRGHRHCGRYC